MPIFEVQGPDGKTYEADAPDMASAASAFGPAPPPPQAPPKSGVDQALDALKQSYASVSEPTAHILSSMVAKPVSDIAGLAATAHDALTGSDGDPAGFKQHVQDSLTYQPRTEAGQNVVKAVGTVMKPISAYTNWAGDFYSNALRTLGVPEKVTDAVKNGETEAAGQAMNFGGEAPGQIVNAAHAAVRNKLLSLESSAAPRVAGAVADAQNVNPGIQTVAQTTGSPLLAKLGQGAAGAKTAEASARIVDQLSGGMTAQATKITPLGVSSPEVAGQVAKVVAQKDADLAQRGEAVYTSGRSVVAKDPTVVATPNTVGAVDQMLAESQNPKNLAPPVVTKRLQAMIDTLRPQAVKPVQPTGYIPEPGTRPPPSYQTSMLPAADQMVPGPQNPLASPGGAKWGDFYDLRKQINTLYDEVPKDQITPAMDQTFARLKAAYYQDLASAPAGAAKDAAVKANQVYSGIAAERETLANSVAASVLGKDMKTSIANPDQVLDRLVGLPPAAQKYVRSMLETYSPETLDHLRSYAITKNVSDAGRTGSAATASKTNPRALTPGKLADSGLFTDEQAAELRSRESALSTALTALPEKGAPVAEITPQEAGRLGGGLSPVFLAGKAAQVATRGALEKYLNTPEGRNAILSKPKAGPTATPTKMFIAAVLARVAQERQQQSPPPTGMPGSAPVLPQ